MQSLNSLLVGYWNLQDASGNRLDLVGGNTLTNTNTVTSVDGVIGGASNFVLASSQRLQAASSAVLQGGPKDYTWACWVNLTTKAVDMFILSKNSATLGQQEYALYYYQALDRFAFSAYRATDVAATASGTTSPSTGTWYFLVGWHDEANQINGLDVNASDVATIAQGGAAQAASSATMAIGSYGISGLNYLNGKVCEVGRWDRILTAQERLWLYNKGQGRTYPFDGRYAPGIGRHSRSRRTPGEILF